MNNLQFIHDKFDLLFDNPEAVEAFRNLVLEMAVRGKLVPQDPNDEPASVLLEKIKEEKAKLIEEGKIKREKPLPPIEEDEKPYELPQGWEWVRLGEIGNWGSGATPDRNNPDYYRNGNIPWLKTGELNDSYIEKTEESITELALNKTSVRLNNKGDILIAMYGATIGKLGIANIELTTNQACCACSLYNGVINKYLFYYLLYMRPKFKAQGFGGAQPNYSKHRIVKTIFALPSLNEQSRIVQKIDEIFDMLPKLNDELKKKAEYNQQLNKVTLNKITTAPNDEDLKSSMQFLLSNFDTLYINRENVSELRQAILSLAVQGKLVSQDPNDEPASVLLEKIKAEKEKLIEEGKIKREKPPLLPIKEDEVPYELPQGWKWVRLRECALNIKGVTFKKEQATIEKRKDYILILRGGNIHPLSGELSFDDGLYIPKDTVNNNQYINVGDTLMVASSGTKSSIAKSAFIRRKPIEDTSVGAFLYIIRPLLNVNKFYINIIICKFRQELINTTAGTNISNVSKSSLDKFIIPLPPISEQKRIVQKVDTLMALCDELENTVEKAEQNIETLLQSLLHEVFNHAS